MLHLAVSVDFVLQRRQIGGPLFHFSQGQKSDRAQRHKKQFDEQEGGEQLGSDRRRNASYISDQRVPSSHRRPRWARR
jgi:Mor family transcriptional regulator